MSQSDDLRRRIAQHKPKNEKSKLDDKAVYRAMENVILYLRERFDFEKEYSVYELIFEKTLRVEDMLAHIKRRGNRMEFDYDYIDREIVPDGGVLFLMRRESGEKLPLLFAEIKRQGTNDAREKEGKKRQAVGNAIERLGKNLTGIRAMMNHDKVTPFVCFGWGCDFAPEEKTVLSKVSMLNEFYPLNRTYVFKRDGSADHNAYAPVSMYFRERVWTVEEMTAIMKEIAETTFRYYVF
ncbi:MAG: restriction endonuclease [Clostridia bacterium]|nr:restriction endonuclease [Clostridia bacterium]